MILPIPIPSKGENANISPFAVDISQSLIQNGVNTSYVLGAMLKDTGYKRVGAGAVVSGKTIGGAFNFVQSASVEKMLVTLNNAGGTATQLFYSTALGNWTEIGAAATAWTSIDHKVEMESFLGYCFFVGYNGSAFLPVGSLTGTTFSTTTNVTSMPQAKYIKRYRDRLYLLNVYYGGTAYPYRVVASGVPSSGTISWSTSGSPTDTTGGFLDVDFSDYGTGISENWDRLVVFTKNKMWFYDQSSWKDLYAIGCSNHRTIRNHGVYMIWGNRDGIWISSGGQPENISGNIEAFVKGSNPNNWFAEIVDEEYHLYLGTVTANGITYTNCEKIYNIPKNQWRGRELYDDMAIYAKYDDSSTGMRLLMGDKAGQVFNKGKYSDSTLFSEDALTGVAGTGKPIAVNFELAPLVLNGYSLSQQVDNLIAYADRAQSLSLQARIIDKNTRALTPYMPIGRLSKYVNNFQVDAKKGAILQICGSENSSNPYFSLLGLEIDIQKDSQVLKPLIKT